MLGQGSDVVNGQLITQAVPQAFWPVTYGPMPIGYYPRGGPYNVPPLSAPAVGGGQVNINSFSGASSMQPTPTAGALRSDGSVNYFSIRKSPLPWALLFLILSLLMFHHIHYRGSKG
jgi:hypothetical protein